MYSSRSWWDCVTIHSDNTAQSLVLVIIFHADDVMSAVLFLLGKDIIERNYGGARSKFIMPLKDWTIWNLLKSSQMHKVVNSTMNWLISLFPSWTWSSLCLDGDKMKTMGWTHKSVNGLLKRRWTLNNGCGIIHKMITSSGKTPHCVEGWVYFVCESTSRLKSVRDKPDDL